MLNKITLLMSFSLVFCCCGWTGRIGSEQPAKTVSSASVPAAPTGKGWR
jgi:hypothetical protein